MPAEYFYTERDAMLANLQDALVAQLRHSLAGAPATSLFLSGGDSPGPLYRALASVELPWERIAVALVDERWVPPAHEASNERLVRETLLRQRAAGAPFTGMKSAHALQGAEESAAVAECNRAYRALPKPWSAAVLGMGPDGHTASLFPGAANLPQVLAAKTPCAAVHAPAGGAAGAYSDRMTMTPHALLQCDQLYLLITGRDKRVLYEKALTAPDPLVLPISVFVQQAAVPLTVFWSP